MTGKREWDKEVVDFSENHWEELRSQEAGKPFEWTPEHQAELMACIQDDPCILPENRQAAFRAAMRGEKEWWFATEEVGTEGGPHKIR
jgi:hypothetical protein